MSEQECRVLLVDDEAFFRGMMATKLRQLGYAICEAENGADALAQARARKPKFVIMDVLMPIMDGVAAFYKMKEDPLLKDVPVAFLSAYEDIQHNAGINEKIAKDMGALHCFNKEEEVNTLCGKIDALFEEQGGG
jgi:CheY-like chemotaxis protein